MNIAVITHWFVDCGFEASSFDHSWIKRWRWGWILRCQMIVSQQLMLQLKNSGQTVYDFSQQWLKMAWDTSIFFTPTPCLRMLDSRPNHVDHAPNALLRCCNITHLIARHDLNFSHGVVMGKTETMTAAILLVVTQPLKHLFLGESFVSSCFT